MTSTDNIRRVYIGEPSEKILIEVAGNVGKTDRINPVANYCDCTTCACGSCSCKCSCGACGACYCDCSCSEMSFRGLYEKIDALAVRLGNVTEIVTAIKGGMKL